MTDPPTRPRDVRHEEVRVGVTADSLIVALDTDAHTALTLARALEGRVRCVKVGITLYCAQGPGIVTHLRDMGFDVFLDLKLHDIPHQVESAAREIARLGAAMITVHASGGLEMMRSAVRGSREGAGACGLRAPAVLAVSVLTSSNDATLSEIGVERTTAAQVDLLVGLSRQAGVHGVVCSPWEAEMAREKLGPAALIVTPGVRPAGAPVNDQSRVATPRQALDAGASHVVIGRPVTGAPDPVLAVENLLNERWA